MAKKAAKKKTPAKKAASAAKKKASTKSTSKSSTKSVAKKNSAKKAATKKAAAKKTPAKKTPPRSSGSTTTKKTAVAKKKKAPVKKVAMTKKIPMTKPVLKTTPPPATGGSVVKRKKLTTAFLKKQKQKLLDLRDNLVDQMNGVARETLRGSGEGSESGFGMHQADAGSDSYDRDFALNLLSQEQDALYEIDEALKRMELGTYGICEESGEPIPEPRLEAMPFARLTVVCQEKRDQQTAIGHHREPVTSLFGLDDKESTAR